MSSQLLSDAYFRLLFYLHGPSRSSCWSSGSQLSLDHHQGTDVLLLRAVSGYVSAPALFFRPPRPSVIFYLLYFGVLAGQHHFGFLTVEILKYTRAAFSCVFCCVINGVRGVYFHFLGEQKKKRYECLRCHCPLTCPAGWKGFLTHPSHARALQSIRGAGHRLGRLGIWIPPQKKTSISL